MSIKLNLINNVPMELRQLKQWICWEARQKGDRITKVPIFPATQREISIANQSNWMSFNEAIDAYERYDISGIGFVFTSEDPYVGIDIDKCIDDNGYFSEKTREIVEQVASYSELSPSGTGIHIICKGILPKGKNKNDKLGLEVYDHARYFTFTGDVMPGYEDINDRTAQVIELYNKYLVSQKKEVAQVKKDIKKNELTERHKTDWKDTLRILSEMKNGQQIMNLYRGHWGGLYSSQNSADLAFCNALAFATAKDASKMDQIFRNSGLYRKKWDEVHFSGRITYGEATIQKAIDGCTTVYAPTFRGKEIKKVINPEMLRCEEKNMLPAWYETNPRTETVKFKPGILVEHLIKTVNIKFFGGSLHSYQDGVYEELKEIQAKSIINEYLLSEYVRAVDTRDTLELWKIALVKDEESINELLSEKIINFQNGLYNTSTKEFTPHTSTHISKVQLNCCYDESAECPQFMRFLTDSLHPEVIPIIQEIMGYLLVPVTKAQKAFIFFGPGRTGKSTLIGLVEAIIGERNISHVPLQMLEGRFDKASLHGKLLNTCADLPAKPLTDTSVFKILTGEDVIQAERKYQEPFSFKNKARLLFSCNQLPTNEIDRTDGFYRRLLIVPFLNQIPEAQIDPDLMDCLKDERDGIAMWALEGLKNLSANAYRFTNSDITNRLLDGYKSHGDSVQWFIEEYCELSTNEKMYSKALFEYYEQVCKGNGIQPKSNAKFIEGLVALCEHAISRDHESKTKRAVITGIRLKLEPTQAA